MAVLRPIKCTEDELTNAYAALDAFRRGARKVSVTVDGDTAEWARVSLPEFENHVSGMQSYRDSVSGDVVSAFNIIPTKGF